MRFASAEDNASRKNQGQRTSQAKHSKEESARARCGFVFVDKRDAKLREIMVGSQVRGEGKWGGGGCVEDSEGREQRKECDRGPERERRRGTELQNVEEKEEKTTTTATAAWTERRRRREDWLAAASSLCRASSRKTTINNNNNKNKRTRSSINPGQPARERGERASGTRRPLSFPPTGDVRLVRVGTKPD
ncbi:hypothetical protein P170DRAFT_14245 [Aspergillus steynii IBT 23096]|uniref:Uncharacterized protein n=1 Tax=Aspergillus steynii IBT 23096 TaxID=1392250 RepID=A0A2I2GN65_9EURO|nr:uncharacterized protein P170DRAFT_14245 [Aspergillus steynii IBT 23096]PLB54328.1 hypothetical protein P170DRAFT_14245 [Aspergillus steynii IBT 23096]